MDPCITPLLPDRSLCKACLRGERNGLTGLRTSRAAGFMGATI